MDSLDAIHKLSVDYGLPYHEIRSVFDDELEYERTDIKRRYPRSRNQYQQAIGNVYYRLDLWLQGQRKSRRDLSSPARMATWVATHRRAYCYCTIVPVKKKGDQSS